MLRYVLIALCVLLLSAGVVHAESPAETEFPHIHEILVGGGSYGTVVVGYVGPLSANGLPTLALTFKLDKGEFVVDEFLGGCEYWPTTCSGDIPPADLVEAQTLALWALGVMNSAPPGVSYVDEDPAGLTIAHAYQFLYDAAASIRYPGLPGRWVYLLEYGRGGFSLWLEGNYPDGGVYLNWDSRSKVWYSHASSYEPEWRALRDYSLALLNGLPAPDMPEHPQLEEYGEYLRALREFQRSAVHTSFAPVVGR